MEEIKDPEGISELEHYGRLAFAESTMWAEFLRAYIAKTRRSPRRTTKTRERKGEQVDQPNEHNQSTATVNAKFGIPGSAKFGQDFGGGIKNGSLEWYVCDGLNDEEDREP